MDEKWHRLERFAERNRKHPTRAEKKLWKYLQGLRPYWSFQSVQYPFIVDFYCKDLRLVIEVDGAYHFTPEQRGLDERRQRYIEREYGVRVERLTNRQVLGPMFTCLERIGLIALPEPVVVVDLDAERIKSQKSADEYLANVIRKRLRRGA